MAFAFLSVFLWKSILYGAFVWARRALNDRKRRFPARAGISIVRLIALLRLGASDDPDVASMPDGPTSRGRVCHYVPVSI